MEPACTYIVVIWRAVLRRLRKVKSMIPSVVDLVATISNQ